MIGSTFDSIKFGQDDLSVCCRREQHPKIVSGSNVDLFMSRAIHFIVRKIISTLGVVRHD